MRTKHLVPGVAVIGFLSLAATANTACADTISVTRAQSMVTSAEHHNAALLTRYPSLQAVEDVVKADCAARVSGETISSAFCECAAAVTMQLWRSGADPNMIKLLRDYVAKPDPTNATGFVKYEGPELYLPLCKLAEQN